MPVGVLGAGCGATHTFFVEQHSHEIRLKENVCVGGDLNCLRTRNAYTIDHNSSRYVDKGQRCFVLLEKIPTSTYIRTTFKCEFLG